MIRILKTITNIFLIVLLVTGNSFSANYPFARETLATKPSLPKNLDLHPKQLDEFDFLPGHIEVRQEIPDDIEMIVMDWDDNLQKSRDFQIRVEATTFAKYRFGPRPTVTQIEIIVAEMKSVVDSTKGLLRRVLENSPNIKTFDLDVEFSKFLRSYVRFMFAFYETDGWQEEVPFYPGVFDLLARLKETGVSMHVLSAAIEEMKEGVATRVGIREFFDLIIGSSSTIVPKKEYSKVEGLEFLRDYESKKRELEAPIRRNQVVMSEDSVSTVREVVEAGYIAVGFAETEEKLAAMRDAGAHIIVHGDFRNYEDLIRALKLKSPVPDWYHKYVYKKLAELPENETGEMLRETWKLAAYDPNNPLVRAVVALDEEGVSHSTLKRLIDTLLGMGLDLENPWATSYTISDIIGYMSLELLGEDLSELKPLVRSREQNRIDVESFDTPPAIKVPEDASIKELKMLHQKLFQEQQRLVRSTRDFSAIGNQIMVRSNRFTESAINILLKRVWNELGIPEDSDGFVFFRERNTFASDLDFYYEGPKKAEVYERLTRYLTQIGYYVDVWLPLFIEEKIEEGDIDYNVITFFFGGRIAGGDPDSFDSFFQEKVLAQGDSDLIWQSLHPYISKQIALLNGEAVPDSFPVEANDAKELHVQLVRNLLFGFYVKYGISGLEKGYLHFFKELEALLPPDELNVLKRVFNFGNQTRNLYQLRSGRLWHDYDSIDTEIIRGVFAKQKVPDYEAFTAKLAKDIGAIYQRYFGDPEPSSVEYETRPNSQAQVLAWQKSASIFKRLLEENTPKQGVAFFKSA